MFKRLWSVCLMLTSALLLATTSTSAKQARTDGSHRGPSIEIPKSSHGASWNAPAPPTMTPEPGDDDVPSRNGVPPTRRMGQSGGSAKAGIADRDEPVARSWNLDELLANWRLRLLTVLRASR